MSESLKSKTIKGTIWTGLERLGSLGISFVITIFLSRLLSPSDYGVIGMLGIFISVSQMLIDCGFTTALIRKKEQLEEDYSTVFWCNLGMSTICYTVLFIAAPWIARFYSMPILVSVLKVFGLTLIINALFSVQVTRLTAMIDFKTQAKVTLSRTALCGVLGITLAYFGLGVWALVGQQLFYSVYSLVVYWSVTGWHPKFIFSMKSFKELFGFGSKLMFSGFLNTIYDNIAPLIIGRKYSAADLGFYSRGDSMAALPGSIFKGTMGKVIFPVLASIQDDEPRLRAAYGKYLRLTASIVAPSMLLLAAVGTPFISVLIGEKWLPCVPYLQLLAFAWMLDPIIAVNLNILNVKGRSDIFLKLEVIKKIIAFIIVMVSVQFGVIWLCVGRVIYSFVALVLNLNYCGPFIGMGFFKQIKEVSKIYMAAFVSAMLTWLLSEYGCYSKFIGSVFVNNLVSLVISGCVGIVLYVVLAVALKFDLIEELKILWKKSRGRR